MSRWPLAIIVAIATVSGALAQNPPRFRVERPLQPGGPGPNRAEVDVPLLADTARPLRRPLPPGADARDGLGDLRLFDASGREVPYLLVPPAASEARMQAGAILPIAASDDRSGFEVDLQAPVLVDRLHVEGIAPPFLKRFRLEGSGDRQRWIVLEEEGTLFDLPDERLQRLDLDLPVGEYRYFRLTWNDASSGRVDLPRRVLARLAAESARQSPPLTVPLAIDTRPGEPRRSHYRLRLPGAPLPVVALRLDVEGAYVMRAATVSEPRFDGRHLEPEIIGTGMLKRVTRDGVQADELTIPLYQSPGHAELDLAIQDDDNPPLAIRGVTAVFAPLPVIYFESDGGPLVARYGDAQLQAPRYDLEAVRPTLVIDRAEHARWGEPRALAPAETTAAPLAISAGAPLDVSRFRYARPIAVDRGGLSTLPLDAAVLAHSTMSGADVFSDVRIVDAHGRQVPYIVERRDEPLIVALTVESSEGPPAAARVEAGRKTWYRVTLPYESLPEPRLVLRTTARVFRREVQVVQKLSDDPGPRPRYGAPHMADWVHAESAVAAPPLTFSLDARADAEVFVGVDEGDNSVLPVTAAELLLPSYRLRFYAPEEASLRLVYGASIDAPDYDLALLAPTVLSATATDVVVAPEAGAAVDPLREALVQPAVFWAVLALAILVLLVIIVRLVRAPATTSASSEAPGNS